MIVIGSNVEKMDVVEEAIAQEKEFTIGDYILLLQNNLEVALFFLEEHSLEDALTHASKYNLCTDFLRQQLPKADEALLADLLAIAQKIAYFTILDDVIPLVQQFNNEWKYIVWLNFITENAINLDVPVLTTHLQTIYSQTNNPNITPFIQSIALWNLLQLYPSEYEKTWNLFYQQHQSNPQIKIRFTPVLGT